MATHIHKTNGKHTKNEATKKFFLKYKKNNITFIPQMQVSMMTARTIGLPWPQ